MFGGHFNTEVVFSLGAKQLLLEAFMCSEVAPISGFVRTFASCVCPSFLNAKN